MSNPWDRQRKDGKLEPALWFERFTLYCKLGASRTLMGAQNEYRVQHGNKKYNSVSGSWTKASKEWNWRARAEAWDAAELARREELFRQQCDAWAENRFNDAELIRKKALDLLAFPVSERESVDDKGREFVIKPLEPKMARAATAMLKDADYLARITTGEALPVQKVAPVTPDGKETYDPDASLKSEILSALHSLAQASAEKDGN